MDKLIKTTSALPVKTVQGFDRDGNPATMDLQGVVMLTNLQATDYLPDRTVLVVQRHLLTMIETIIERDEAVVLARDLASHFGMSAEELQVGGDHE